MTNNGNNSFCQFGHICQHSKHEETLEDEDKPVSQLPSQCCVCIVIPILNSITVARDKYPYIIIENLILRLLKTQLKLNIFKQ